MNNPSKKENIFNIMNNESVRQQIIQLRRNKLIKNRRNERNKVIKLLRAKYGNKFNDILSLYNTPSDPSSVSNISSSNNPSSSLSSSSSSSSITNISPSSSITNIYSLNNPSFTLPNLPKGVQFATFNKPTFKITQPVLIQSNLPESPFIIPSRKAVKTQIQSPEIIQITTEEPRPQPTLNIFRGEQQSTQTNKNSSFLTNLNKQITISLLDLLQSDPQLLSKTNITPENIRSNKTNKKNQYYIFNGFEEFTINRRIVHEVNKCFILPNHSQSFLNFLLSLQTFTNDLSNNSTLKTMIFPRLFAQDEPSENWELRELKNSAFQNNINSFSHDNDKNLISTYVVFKKTFSPPQLFKTDNYIIRQFDPNIHTIYVEIEKTYLVYNKNNPEYSFKIFFTGNFYVTIDQNNRIILDNSQIIEPPTICIKHTSYMFDNIELLSSFVSELYYQHKGIIDPSMTTNTIFDFSINYNNNPNITSIYYNNHSNKNTISNRRNTKQSIRELFAIDLPRSKFILNNIFCQLMNNFSINSSRELLFSLILNQSFDFNIYASSLVLIKKIVKDLDIYPVSNNLKKIYIYDKKLVIDYLVIYEIKDMMIQNLIHSYSFVRSRAIFTIPATQDISFNSPNITDILVKNTKTLFDIKFIPFSESINSIVTNFNKFNINDELLNNINNQLNNNVFETFYDSLIHIFPNLFESSNANNTNIVQFYENMNRNRNANQFKNIANFDFLQNLIQFANSIASKKPDKSADIQIMKINLYVTYFQNVQSAIYPRINPILIFINTLLSFI